MKRTMHTFMLTVAAVSLTAGVALAADQTINGPATGEAAVSADVQQDMSATTHMSDDTQIQASASAGSQVENVQAKLKAEGYPVSVDGVWGPKSSSALRQFQQANNLDTSGQINAETLTAMNINTQ